MPAFSESTLQSESVVRVLDRLYSVSEEIDPDIVSHAKKEAQNRGKATDSGVADLLGKAFLPVSREMGRLLYILARTQNSRTIVEFGTSFGISTIFLASALRDNGGGLVITSELNAEKVKAARFNLHEASLSELVEIREGDALTTLRETESTVDLLFLDGWKDAYLPVLKLIEPHLRHGSLVIADDLDIYPDVLKPYLDYVRHPKSGYISVEVPLGDRIEVSLLP
jgi:predicted O-methyltransferase YrrM